MPISDMSDYERRAYLALNEPPKMSRTVIPEPIRRLARRGADKVASVASQVPGAEAVELAYGKALQGLTRATTGLGLQSVSVEGAVKRHRKRNPAVQVPGDIRRLDLEMCDLALPSKKQIHGAVAVLEGAAASLAITGATVSTTVSGGAAAGVVVGAVAADSFAVLSGLGRIVGEVACVYGYDPRLPEEELFALQVVGLSLAVGDAAKATAMASLSRLTQEMMRRATWTQLEKHVLVKVIQRAFAQLGLQLTHRKLAQVVPAAGVVVSVGVNLKFVQDTHDAAQRAYRLRFLVEKYQLGVSTELVVPDTGESTSDAENGLRVDELLDEAVAESQAAATELY